jgi:hypothetical protein
MKTSTHRFTRLLCRSPERRASPADTGGSPPACGGWKRSYTSITLGV